MTSVRPDTADALLRRIARCRASDRQPSVVPVWSATERWSWTGVARAASRGRRCARSDVQYRIGSLTKTMTAVLVLQCRDDGLLDLDDAGRQALPGSASGTDAPAAARARRRDARRAGGPVVGAQPGRPVRPAGGRDRQSQALGPADRRHHYSNVGYALLGAVVARVRGATWLDLVQERILDPLGMRRTTYGPSGRTHRAGRCTRSAGSSRGAAHRHRGDGAGRPAVEHGRGPGDAGAFWLDPVHAMLSRPRSRRWRPRSAADPGRRPRVRARACG